MTLTPAQKKHFKTIGHSLKPVVLLGEQGLTEGVIKEADRALTDHELIKIKFNFAEKEERQAAMEELAAKLRAVVVQSVGKMGLFYRKARKPNPRLSNLSDW